jgi:hypothetical protein
VIDYSKNFIQYYNVNVWIFIGFKEYNSKNIQTS